MNKQILVIGLAFFTTLNITAIAEREALTLPSSPVIQKMPPAQIAMFEVRKTMRSINESIQKLNAELSSLQQELIKALGIKNISTRDLQAWLYPDTIKAKPLMEEVRPFGSVLEENQSR